MMKTGLVYHPDYLKHEQTPGHPEAPERVKATFEYLESTPLMADIKLLTPEPATAEAVGLIHQSEHIRLIRQLSEVGGGRADPDTFVGPETYKVALLAAGGAISAADSVMSGDITNCFGLLRPPGHHASQNQAAGFCYFNNVAIMIRYIQKKYNLGRVFLFDWDAHAFNGTMKVFYQDDSVLSVSIHQDPRSFYPGDCFIEQTGEGKGTGYTVNLPVPAGSADADYIYLMENFVIPKARQFKPDFIAVSAGFDSHTDDSMSGLCLSEAGYAKMTELLMELAEETCDGKLTMVLEGGYDIESLKKSIHRVISTMRGTPAPAINGRIGDQTPRILRRLEEVFD